MVKRREDGLKVSLHLDRLVLLVDVASVDVLAEAKDHLPQESASFLQRAAVASAAQKHLKHQVVLGEVLVDHIRLIIHGRARGRLVSILLVSRCGLHGRQRRANGQLLIVCHLLLIR